MADLQGIIGTIKDLTVKELNDLVKLIEEEFGVSASALAAAAPAAGGASASAEEKSDFVLHLADVGANKMAVIKLVKEVTGLGLKEAKEKVDKAPSDLKEGVPDAEAKEIQKKFEEAGAKLELKQRKK